MTQLLSGIYMDVIISIIIEIVSTQAMKRHRVYSKLSSVMTN